MFPEIHLWCNTSACVYSQHSSQLLSPHACFSRGRMPDLSHRPPAWQADALTTRPQRPNLSVDFLVFTCTSIYFKNFAHFCVRAVNGKLYEVTSQNCPRAMEPFIDQTRNSASVYFRNLLSNFCKWF